MLRELLQNACQNKYGCEKYVIRFESSSSSRVPLLDFFIIYFLSYWKLVYEVFSLIL